MYTQVKKSGLKLLSHEEYILEDPFHNELFTDGKGKITTEEYAERVRWINAINKEAYCSK